MSEVNRKVESEDEKDQQRVTLIHDLQNANKKLSADMEAMRHNLKLEDEATKMQFHILQHKFEELNAVAEKRNHLIVSIFKQLQTTDLKTSSSVEEMLCELLAGSEDLKARKELPKQQEECKISYEHFFANKQHIEEMEQTLKTLKEEVDELKRREHLRLSSTIETEDLSKDEEEGQTTSKSNIDSSHGVYDVTLTERIVMKEEDELEHHFLPSDTYSYFAVAEYFKRGGQYCIIAPTPAFLLASFTLTIQIVTLSIFTFDVVDYRNKGNPLGVPAGVGTQVRVSQLIALLISCFNQDEVRTSFNVLWLGYRKSQVRTINYTATRYKWYLSFSTRIVLGWFSLIVTFILIINSDTVRDVMLDFAAVTFVSELDNGAFQLSLWGYMGKDVQQLTMKIKNIMVYEKSTSSRRSSLQKRKRVPRLVWLSLLIGLVIGFWAWVTVKQQRGDYLNQSVFVQFGDDFSPAMGAFSGIYTIELDDTLDGMRVNYVEQQGRKSDGRFLYCSQDKRWLFQYGDEPEDYNNRHWFSECWHKARSSQTESYDLTRTSDITWFVLDEDMSPLENPLQHFLVKGQNYYYGQSCGSDFDCGERMYCNDDDHKTCMCKDGLFGLNCEFRKPCHTLEIDSRDPNGFFGTRSWSRRYSSLVQYAGEGEENNNNTSPIQVYGKPVYVGEESIKGIFDVMIFTGRRWILTDSVSITDYNRSDDDEKANTVYAKRNLADFLANNFHAYWSNYTFHFATEPVDVGTPTDSATPVGLQWFRLETTGTQGASLRSGEQIWQGKMIIDAKLLCAVCHNETNPCFYGASCQADETCNCTTGSSGTLCQIPPDDNGNCDSFFNTPEFAFDGGDCCQETCTSTERYICGNGMINNSAGVSAYGFIGYPDCQDPRFKFKLSGSTTLYEIVEERGFVRCGNAAYDPGFFEIAKDGSLSGFEVDLCKSIAAAALGNPEAVEIVRTSWVDRWNDLAEGKFDLLLSRTTHTAERDIFQNDAKTGFSFASTLEFFDGLRYAGIPPYAECADNLDVESQECINLSICVAGSTTWYEVTRSLFPDSMIVAVDSHEAEIYGLEAGICNVIAGEINLVNEFSVRDIGFTGPFYTLGKNIYSKEPLSAVTREDDRVWSKFVSWVFEALIQAEESGITKSNANKIATTDVFGEQFQHMFQNAVAANGNFGDIYNKNLEVLIPRGGLNTVNTGSNGLIYSFPFGAIDTVGPGPIAGGSIDEIRKRGILNCGITTSPGFAELDAKTGIWSGFEVDMCRGVAGALFNGSPNVNLIPLSFAERFVALADGLVDIMTCATTHTLSREVNEVNTGQGFDFTPAIFYDGLGFGGRPPYVGCAEFLLFGDTDCHDTKICVPGGSTWLDAMMGPLGIPEVNIVATIDQEETYYRFVSGDCNVIAGESSQIAEATIRGLGFPENQEYIVGVNKFTKEPLAIVSRSDDNQFSDFLRWIVYGFFYAEEQKITRQDYYDMPASNYLFGNELSGMWQHSVEAVGNYGEIFERNFEGTMERGGPHNLNNNNGPQFYAKPGVTLKQ